MNRKFYLLFASILIVYLGFLVIKFVNSPSSKQPHLQTKSLAPLPKEVTVLLGINGFSPKEIKITVGSAVRWKNESGDKQTVNSDDYPTNQLHKELNFGTFANGSSVVYIFKSPGTYGYHNQFHPEQSGEVVVK